MQLQLSDSSLVQSLKPAIDLMGKGQNRVIPHAEGAIYHDALALMIKCMGGPDYRSVLGETQEIPVHEIETLLSWSLSTMAAINADPDGFTAWVGKQDLAVLDEAGDDN